MSLCLQFYISFTTSKGYDLKQQGRFLELDSQGSQVKGQILRLLFTILGAHFSPGIISKGIRSFMFVSTFIGEEEIIRSKQAHNVEYRSSAVCQHTWEA